MNVRSVRGGGFVKRPEWIRSSVATFSVPAPPADRDHLEQTSALEDASSSCAEGETQ